MSDLVSIIVPVYKVEAYLRQCIDSILAQTYTNIELILVDDGSPDACPQICDEYAAKDNRVRVFHIKNSGVSIARNTGIEASRGEFITFSDSDDWYEPDYVELLHQAMLDHNAEIAQGTCQMVFPDGRSEIFHKDIMQDEVMTREEAIKDFMLYDGAGKIDGMSWGKMFRRSIGYGCRYDEKYFYEDAMYVCAAVTHENFHKIVLVSKPVYDYRQLPNSRSRSLALDYIIDQWIIMRQYIFSRVSPEHEDEYAAQCHRAFSAVLEVMHHTRPGLPPVGEVIAKRPDILDFMRLIVKAIPARQLAKMGVNWKDVALWRIMRCNLRWGIALMRWWGK